MKTSEEIKASIATGIKDGQSEVKDRVVAHYTEKELERRSNLIIKGLDKLESLEQERDRIKPDQIAVNDQGQEQSSTYSKANFEKLKKAREAVGKLSKALNAAIEQGSQQDYEKLEKTLK